MDGGGVNLHCRMERVDVVRRIPFPMQNVMFVNMLGRAIIVRDYHDVGFLACLSGLSGWRGWDGRRMVLGERC